MNVEEQDRLLCQEPFSPSILRRAFPSLSFYSGVAKVVLRASSQANRGRFDDKAWRDASDGIMAVLRAHGPEISIENLGVLQRTPGPVIIVGNHMSTLETFLLPGLALPYKQITFVVKKSLVDYPIFGSIMRASKPIVVGRDNPREDLRAMLEGGRDAIQAGKSLIIFPQTTRTPKFDREQFNSIGAKLAKRTGAPIIPLALTTDFWSNGKLVKDFGPIRPRRPVRFAFGEPIHVTGASPISHERSSVASSPTAEAISEKEAHKQVADFIESRLAEWA